MRLDEMYYTEIEMEGMKEILRDKEEEIKKLKSDLSLVIKERDDNIEQNKKLKDDLLSYIRRNEDLREQNSYRKKIVDIVPQDEKSVAEETIQDLLKEIKRLEEELESVKEDNRILKNNRNSSVEYSRELEEENKRLSDFLECES